MAEFEEFPDCCTAIILAGVQDWFGYYGAATPSYFKSIELCEYRHARKFSIRYFLTDYWKSKLIKYLASQLALKLLNVVDGGAAVYATLTSGQKLERTVLRHVGFKKIGGEMKKDRHRETTLAMYAFECESSKAMDKARKCFGYNVKIPRKSCSILSNEVREKYIKAGWKPISYLAVGNLKKTSTRIIHTTTEV